MTCLVRKALLFVAVYLSRGPSIGAAPSAAEKESPPLVLSQSRADFLC